MTRVNKGFLQYLEKIIPKTEVFTSVFFRILFFLIKKTWRLFVSIMKGNNMPEMQCCLQYGNIFLLKTVLLWTEHSLNPEYTGDSSWHVLFSLTTQLRFYTAQHIFISTSSTVIAQNRRSHAQVFMRGGVVKQKVSIKCRLLKRHTVL